ncbi:hypothetical protein, partial [Lutibacter sp.]|uniref:hypothetical protein n=1 Tax=Lutibacter sp. TaxID=1925666 RepID=UPI0034A01560
KSIFIEPANSNEPKYLEVSMGFNPDRIMEPHVHILMESDGHGKENGVGMDENVKGSYFEGGGSNEYYNSYTRNFDCRFNIMISSSNSTEVTMIYYVIKALIYSMTRDFDLNGFKNLKISGGGLSPQQQIADKLYLKSIFMEFDYDMTVPRFWNGKFATDIILENTKIETR